jgi:hypothetical protein
MNYTHELTSLLLQRPAERALLGTLRNLVYGMLIGVLLNVFSVFSGESRWEDAFGYLLIGNGLSFLGWGAERLWFSTVSRMLKEPFSWYGYLTRLPFWYIAGGIGYLTGLLVAKKLGLIYVYEIPVKRLFVVGGKTEIILQALLQMRVYLLVRKHPIRNLNL